MINPLFFAQLLRLREHKVSLDQVAQEVLHRLNLSKASTPFEEVLLTAFLRVIHFVNQDADQRLQGEGELRYHNRDHISDVLLSLCFLFLNSPNLPREDQLIGLVAMAGHDLGHQGKTNQELSIPQEVLTAYLIDKNALSALLPSMRERITNLIIGTDPSLVEQNHEAFRQKTSDNDLLLQVLLNEADIAASVLTAFGMQLTENLLIERGVLQPSDALVSATFSDFRGKVLFSSPAAIALLGSAQEW
jgi:hypothetical protein